MYIRIKLILIIIFRKDIRNIDVGVSSRVWCETHDGGNGMWAYIVCWRQSGGDGGNKVFLFGDIDNYLGDGFVPTTCV